MFANMFRYIFISTLGLHLSSILPSVYCYRNASFEQGLTNLQYDGISRPQILSWWDAHQRDLANIRNSTRVFPICITRNESGHYPPRMENWGRLLDHIALKDERVTMQHYHRHQDLKEERFYLDSWVFIHIRNYFLVKGMYVQLMAGPLGVPAGEFVTGLPCNQTLAPYPSLNPNFVKEHFIVPCSYAPRSSSQWPNTFMYDGEPRFDFAFQIRWNEAQCGEFGFFQMIIIVTRNFTPDQPDDYKAVLVSIIEPGINGSGPYTPYNGGYDLHLHCNILNAAKFNGIQRLVPNKQYDDCVTKGTGREEGLMGWTCPPGPFECDRSWSSADDWRLKIHNSVSILTAYEKMPPKDRDCCEIGEIPEIILTTEPPEPVAAKEKELAKKTKHVERQSKVTHGGICIFTWLVLIPIADHIARFYKDLPDILSLGLGFWIIVHVTLHCVGVALIWFSFGLVVGKWLKK
ncbi:unnamed protein product [Orchesella dallaii]|uniref:Uncharacterized protein n=1 Tax=Orchesella dallaii TaxID=48710 RepID=A0ABP1PJ05_9HEXA